MLSKARQIPEKERKHIIIFHLPERMQGNICKACNYVRVYYSLSVGTVLALRLNHHLYFENTVTNREM